uniref:Uncharacterized protein n=1 Tax=Alexandrium monilatum TaxID=311494 RepID=A0A7S4R324_9DINO|mmetsp:Transcript_40919/g.127480  ORF Transcript_40919/g.127480 Transcript_40919/m.127480 type:complete len:790 (-) Transcript_40919:54-2423(-)
MKGEGEVGAIVLGLEEGNADLLLSDKGKLLQCMQGVLDAEIEVSVDAKADGDKPAVEGDKGEAAEEEKETGPPKMLTVASPNGQKECDGEYALVAEETVNGQPLWKQLEAKRWLYSGTDGTWLIGGPKQKEQGFACRTGFLHLRQAHEGKLPHLVEAMWRRVDGKQWREDGDIRVSVFTPPPDKLRPGLSVTVDGLQKRPLRRLNGAFGRLLEREGEGSSEATWRVRLAEGCEERLPATNLEPRMPASEYGEAWARPRGQQLAEQAVLSRTLGAALRLACEVLAPDSEGQIAKVPKVLAASCSQVRVPETASEAVSVVVGEVENDLQVACFWKYQEDDEPDEDLVPGAAATALYEGSRCGCHLKEVHAPTEQATVTWDYDGTESEVPLADVKPKLDKAGKERRQRRQWLRGAWVLVILGAARQRQLAALRVLASIEDSCPGLWTTDLNDAVAEVRRSPASQPGSSPSVGVEARPLAGGDAEPWLSQAYGDGRLTLSALRRVSNAANVGLEFLLPSGLFLVGTKPERSRALDYLRWLVAEGGSDAARGSSERALRGDVAVLRTVRGRSVWLEPTVLRGIERETKTLILLEHGEKEAAEGKSGKAADWDAQGPAEVHICGFDPGFRSRAVGQMEGLLQAMALNAEAEEDRGESQVKRRKVAPEDPTKASKLEKELQEERQRREDLEKKLREAEEERQKLEEEGKKLADAAAAAPPAAAQMRPSDPLSELRKLKFWPKDNRAWLSLQDTIWANHPQLAQGWIRVWSRSKDQEYYVRLTDGRTTLNYAEAKAS